MPLSAARRWLKFLLRGCWAARLLECAGLPLLRRTRGLELLQSCGKCFGAPLPLAVACLFALGGLAARTRDAPAGTPLMTRWLRDHAPPWSSHCPSICVGEGGGGSADD
ncbi:hypothetical protein ERJ75_001697400 [Trypanosoma vivax]|nr:hypothetical protein ERJ75_001697400 [Trypanosoma vivax]